MELFGRQVQYIPSFWWALVAIGVIMLISFFSVKTKSSFGVMFAWMYEEMYDFFAGILGEHELTWIKSFIANMFFVILFYNLLGLLFDFIGPIFGYNEANEVYYLAEVIWFWTSDYHFTIAMALVGVLIMLGIQFVTMSDKEMLWKKVHSWGSVFGGLIKIFNIIYEYVPFWGKWIITVEKWNMKPIVFYPLRVIIKAFDILISVFVWFLDIIGLLAKVISLAFRLFGNMLSGTALLTVLVLWLSASTANWFGVELPLIAPLILVLQWLLVASIQAFVFPLLVAIFIKVARMWSGEEAAA